MNNKNEKKQKYEAIKLNKNQFSKTTNNLCLNPEIKIIFYHHEHQIP